MKKFHICTSFILIVLLSICFNKFSLLINYFLALSLHEMAHIFVAINKGYKLKQVRLDIFGMSVELDESIDTQDNFAVNIAGPLCNILISVSCVALYCLIPMTYWVLKDFCVANLVLAVFNLLPIYPLDGGKIFRGFVKSDKTYKILDIVVRFSLVLMCLTGFVFSCFKSANYLLLLLSFFFVVSKGKQEPTMSIFKYKKAKVYRVELLKVSEEENLFNLIKRIKSNYYTIFYCPQTKRYIDEDSLIDLATKFPLTNTLKELK